MFIIVNGPGIRCPLTDLTVWEPNMLHKYRSDGSKPQIHKEFDKSVVTPASFRPMVKPNRK